MSTRQALIGLAVLALSGPVLAACTGDWAAPTAETMVVSDGTELRITRFANLEMKLALVQAGRPVEFLGALGIGYLVKGIPEAELQKFAQEAHWLLAFSAPASTIVWRAIRGDPCKASGPYDIDMVPWSGGASQAPDHKLLRARGQAVADGQGLIRYTIRFDTEPALPPDRPLTYAGTLSFVKQGDEMPGDTDVGGFNVMPQDKPGFVAVPGTKLSQLRAMLSP
ncbi:hypothetical protein ASC95_07780 [Pelomonas sp. Root1217]|uniref:hypothetical protein n=1 Tax=Pelomonas sp. Root1217 TaxID=1736430 RepID=UPI000711221F|nr:hypothetical protein [Pelomonas sp. Root1217]KQV52712.1 hypothetical protein ASC95_07780 [Pelomonas sp. Root1217]